MQLSLEGHNEENNTFAIAVVVLEEQQAALQLMAVAAPRSGGFWSEVMDELEAEISQAGGTMSRSEGRFGTELSGEVPAQDANGATAMQPARFVGAEGNRWFIRGMFMGTAATSPAMGEFFEDILAGCIVNRGERPMAPGDLIPLSPRRASRPKRSTRTPRRRSTRTWSPSSGVRRSPRPARPHQRSCARAADDGR